MLLKTLPSFSVRTYFDSIKDADAAHSGMRLRAYQEIFESFGDPTFNWEISKHGSKTFSKIKVLCHEYGVQNTTTVSTGDFRQAIVKELHIHINPVNAATLQGMLTYEPYWNGSGL